MKTYPNPFISERADPYITKGSDGYYYFTASYPALHSENNGYDRIILRRSKTLIGLRDAEEKAVWLAHKEGIMAKHIWAPEIHEIEGKWYIYFAAGDSDNKWNIRPYVLRLDGNDPYNDIWEEMGRVQPKEGDSLSFSNFSLDMTHFEHRGKHYLIWAQSAPDSSILMAQTKGDEPYRLISEPLILSRPEYSWEKIRFRVNEGPAVLKLGGKIYIFFSASGTGAEYCMSYIYADENADLLNTASWTKLDRPCIQTSDLSGEVGPGHNSFCCDEDGELLIIYHSRPQSHLKGNCGTFDKESLYDPCRHTRVKPLADFGIIP